MRIDATEELVPEAPYELVSRMRASINVLGPLLARCGWARVAMPGGDNIGSRKLDMHFRGLEALGAELSVVHGFIEARCNALAGARIVLDFPSVGATENLLTASVLAKGETVIENAAREPEISDLVELLTLMGARIDGAGTSTLWIEGVDELHAVDHEVVGDRVEAGTLLMACGIAGGDITLRGHPSRTPRDGRREAPGDGAADHRDARRPVGPRRSTGSSAIDLATLPYPGFATDFMPMAVALLAVAEGTAIVTENVFDNRFGFVDELCRMGADVRNEGRHAVVRGLPRLSAAPVRALDVRAGAALVLAGLAADGETHRLRADPRRPGLRRSGREPPRPRRRRRSRRPLTRPRELGPGRSRAVVVRRVGNTCDTGGVPPSGGT